MSVWESCGFVLMASKEVWFTVYGDCRFIIKEAKPVGVIENAVWASTVLKNTRP